MLSIELEAHNATRNVMRRYSISVGARPSRRLCVTFRFGGAPAFTDRSDDLLGVKSTAAKENRELPATASK